MTTRVNLGLEVKACRNWEDGDNHLLRHIKDLDQKMKLNLKRIIYMN